MRARLIVDLAAIAANWRRLAVAGAPAETAAVVKADAYGLGLAAVAPTLARAGCRHFFVARLEEGIALRALLPDSRIFVLDGVGPGEAGVFRAHRLVPVLNHEGQIARWREAAAAAGEPLEAALHVDTGMTRLGLADDRVLALEPADFEGIRLVLIVSHLACADDPDHPLNARQLSTFLGIRQRFATIPASLAASSGIFLGRAFHFDLLRPGAALYGVNPTPGRPNPMQPVVELRAPVIQIHDIRSVRTVGYGATRELPSGVRVATIAAGYADGILRAASDRAVARYADFELPIVGRVSMDLVTLDVSAVPPERIGEGCEVTLIGGADGVDRLAAAAGTIGYEVLARLGPRCARHYLPAEPGP
ncbi:Alanine racemase, biosynthetic [bacterium HR40]|nr:Alanine racemase, biosynthetic [bacterium HR40]